MHTSESPATALAPQLPPALNVLVAGHQPNRLPPEGRQREQLWAILERILHDIREVAIHEFSAAGLSEPRLYDTVAPSFRLLTGDADGVDRKAAELASRLKYSLQLLIPHALSDEAHASSNIALALGAEPQKSRCCDREHLDPQAYALRDEIALGFADVLVAIWDGKAPQGLAGGTARLVHRAVLAMKPVIWIGTDGAVRHLKLESVTESTRVRLNALETTGDDLIELFTQPTQEMASSTLRALRDRLNPELTHEHESTLHALKDVLGLGRHHAADDSDVAERAKLRRYFTERPDANWLERNAGWVHRKLTQLATYQTAAEIHSAESLTPPTPPQEAPHEGSAALNPTFAWSSARAAVAAGRHRSLNWLLYLFASLAVLFAVLGGLMHWSVAPYVELALILAILGLTVWSRRQRWHQRWLSHRYIREQLRFQEVVLPLAAFLPPFVEPLWRPDGKGGLLLTSAENWLLQRLLLGAGLPRVEVNARTPVLETVRDCIQGQLEYHHRAHHTNELLHHRLHTLTTLLFVLTAVAVLAHFLVHAEWLVLVTTFFPALGAGIHGILTQAEAQRLAETSQTIAARLEVYMDALAREEKSKTPWKAFADLRRVTTEAAIVMSVENSQWLSLVRSREAGLPA